MQKVPYTTAVSAPLSKKTLSYCTISSIKDYVEGSEVIIVSSLKREYLMLFRKISVIISEKGNELAHLAILAREFQKTLLIAPNVVSSSKKTGTVTIFDSDITLE